jgi:hypothetical protein
MVKLLIGVISVVYISTANCNPYLGMDAQVRHINFKQDFYGITLKRHYPQCNVFVGYMLNDHFGLEAGYSLSKNQYTSKKSNPIFIPNKNPRLNSIKYDMSHATPKFSAWNMNLTGSLPLNESMNLIGSVGVTCLKIQIKNIFSNEQTIHYIKHKSVLRLSGGVQFKLLDYVGLRPTVIWENTSRIMLGNAKPKNSIQYGLGIILTI